MGSRIRENPSHIYEFFGEVAIPLNCTKAPRISWKYPDNYKDEETLRSVSEFAYPCEFNNNAVHHFSFALTNVDSKWTFGFCRHAPNSPTCFVLLSYLPWHETFYRVLNHAAELSNREKSGQSKELQVFLEAMYKVQVPDPGLELHVTYGQDNDEFVALCPDHNKLPSIPENRNMTEYFNAVDAHNMMVIFASMLYERRILMTSKKLSRLSACVQAANALIYPMHWQHIFIPVLPKRLLDYLSAPMPFLIGVPSSTLMRIKCSDLGDIVVLDADNNKVDTPFADLDTLPSDVLQSLRRDLKNPHEMLGDSVARAFLKALVQLIGGYWNALKLKPGEKISFSAELFLQTRPAPMQPFLEKMLQLQIFQQGLTRLKDSETSIIVMAFHSNDSEMSSSGMEFWSNDSQTFIESRLKKLNSGQGVSDEFEFELTVHEDKTSTRLRNQYREWVSNMKKEGGAFFKNVKTKVKGTGKKAYKDIRSRIQVIHNHKVSQDDSALHNFRRRGGSVPTLFAHDFQDSMHIIHQNSKNINYRRENLAQSKSKEHQSNQYSTLQEAEDISIDKNISGQESPRLTFQPIDMDLVGDLQELIFRQCSLCNDKVQKRTSISDPQLIDFTPEDQEEGENESVCCSSTQSPHSSSPSVSIPPPLLPRPPSKAKLQTNNVVFPLSSPDAFRYKKFHQKPLIELDSDITNSGAEKLCVPSTNKFEDKIIDSSKQFISSNNNITELSTNDCAASLSVSEEFSRNLTFFQDKKVKSSNPFHEGFENMDTQCHGASIYKCSSGPNVRNMINMWQSTTPLSENQCLSSSAEKLKATAPLVSPYRSQPLSRTLSSPSSAFSGTQISSCLNTTQFGSVASVKKNPFLGPDDSCKVGSIANSKLTSPSSWENFH